MRKNLMKNNGFPMSVDVEGDLLPVKGAYIDSWYVKAEFESKGKQLGFNAYGRNLSI